LADQVDFENFVENFKISFSESVAKRFLIDKKRYHKLETKIRIAYEVLKRRVLGFGALLQSVNQGQFPVITPE